ncbi:MAG: DUF2339 domain-containing protein [Treponema sp.]|jgi:uncharacterized membrane protein|nr:DUF2339 domain-containing protein [Treponema sp.]
MEGIFYFIAVLIVAAFFFAVIGVIFLLVKSSGYGKRISLLEERFRSLARAPVGAAAPSEGVLAVPAEGTPEESAARVSVEPVPKEAAPMEAVSADRSLLEAAVLSEADGPERAPAEPSEAAGAKPPAEGAVQAEGALAAFIHGGNLWAAGGIVLLLAGFGALITYLANRGFFTVEMGIAASALSGLVMLAAGWRLRDKRPVYFLLLQGGGIGILYLSVFAAHRLTPYFPPLLSLVLLSLLVVPAIVLALYQSSQALALLGFLGGFAAPLLLALVEGNHVFLFAYYTVLDLGVLGVSFFRRWKALKLTAFLFTFILAEFWAVSHYEPRLFWSVEPFFLAYLVIFSILGLPGFDRDTNQLAVGYVDMAVILGTPLMGALLQWKVFDSVEHGYALIALIFSAFYILLALFIWKRRGHLILSEAYLGLGAFLANLAVPLELSPRVTGALWAAEGLLVFFFGLRLRRFRAAAVGIVLHAAAAVAFLADWDLILYGGAAFRSAAFTGSLIIALSALAMVYVAAHHPSLRIRRPALALAVWAFAWWFGGWIYEIRRVFDHPLEILFLCCSASALASFGASKFFRTGVFRFGIIPSLVLGLCLYLRIFVFFPFYRGNPFPLSFNFLQGLFLWGWLSFFAVQALLLFFLRKDLPEKIYGTWLLIFIFVSLGVLSASGRGFTLSRKLAPAWTSFAGLLPVFICMIGIGLSAHGEGPFRIFRARIFPARESPDGLVFRLLSFVLPLVLSCVMGLWFFVTLFLSGDPAPLPFYIPILNPLDLEEAFCIVLFLLWQLPERGGIPVLKRPALFTIVDSAVFLFITALTARAVHFYGGIPYHALAYSDVFHLCLFIVWAVYGIGHVIGGNRLALRKLWIAGAVLTVADIAKFLVLDLSRAAAALRIVSFFVAGLLLLFIGWAAPLPPPERAEDAESGGKP